MNKVLLIVNPISGRGLVGKYLLDIIDTFSRKGIMLTTYVTQSKSDAYRTARREAGNYDVILCTGGDGTLDEVVAGISKSGYRPKIGYIPSGSTNDYAHSLQLPSDMKKSAEIIAEGNTFTVDIGTFNNWYFVYVAAFGAFTDVSYKTNQDMKNMLGHMAYILEGAKSLFDIKPYHMSVTIDDKIIEGDFIFGMITNSESVGGVENIAGNDVELDDGYFEVVLVRNPVTPFDWQPIIFGLMNRQGDDEFIYYLKAKKVHITSTDPVAWTVDGEDGGSHEEVDIVVHEKMLDIYVEKSYLEMLEQK
ncbi:MAG: diacylglycerol kinase family lipid kinase [Eubacterium sp.]|nr:diacylglycerol kinase family lipid kinase [Eubacterium sp.]